MWNAFGVRGIGIPDPACAARRWASGFNAYGVKANYSPSFTITAFTTGAVPSMMLSIVAFVSS